MKTQGNLQVWNLAMENFLEFRRTDGQNSCKTQGNSEGTGN